MITNSIVAVDFDGTICKHDYPRLGAPVPGALKGLRQLIKQGNKIVVWTMRSGSTLRDAERYLEQHGIKLYGLNNVPCREWSMSPKIDADVYIDDKALGCPLIHEEGERPYVDWSKLEL